MTETKWCVGPALVAGPIRDPRAFRSAHKARPYGIEDHTGFRLVGPALVAGPQFIERRSADKPLDPLGALSLSKRRRPYINYIVSAQDGSSARRLP